MAWVEFYRISQQPGDVRVEDEARVDPAHALQVEPQPAITSSCGGDIATLAESKEPPTSKETPMSNEQELINGRTEQCEREENYPALAKIIGVDAKAAARLDEMSADEVEEFIEELEDCEDTLSEIERAKAKLLRLANQKRKLKLADEAPRCEHIKTNGQRWARRQSRALNSATSTVRPGNNVSLKLQPRWQTCRYWKTCIASNSP